MPLSGVLSCIDVNIYISICIPIILLYSHAHTILQWRKHIMYSRPINICVNILVEVRNIIQRYVQVVLRRIQPPLPLTLPLPATIRIVFRSKLQGKAGPIKF